MSVLMHLQSRIRHYFSLLVTMTGLLVIVYMLYDATLRSSIVQLGEMEEKLDTLRKVYKNTMISLEAVDESEVRSRDGATDNHVYGAVDVDKVLKTMKEYQSPTPDMLAAFRTGVDIDEAHLQYNPEYKSPCWNFRGRKMRCLPSVFIVGFPFCSAVDFWYKITRHSDVLSIPTVENHWWTRLRFQDVPLMRYGRYYAKFVETAPNPKNKLIVQSSPQTMWDSATAVTNKNGAPEVLQAHLLKSLLPSSKLIVIMRDPTQRLFVEYLRHASKEKGVLTRFHEAVTVMIQQMQECFEQRTIRDCAYDTSLFPGCHDSRGCIQAGLYAIFISDWLNVFQREQLHFIRAEDTSTHTSVKTSLKDVFGFMLLDKPNNATIDMLANKALPSLEASSTMKYTHQPMFKKTRKILDDFYQPFNNALNHVLNDTKYSWHELTFERSARSRDIYEKERHR